MRKYIAPLHIHTQQQHMQELLHDYVRLLTPSRIPRAPFPFSLLSSSLIRLAALSVTTMGLRFLVLRRRGERDSSCCGMAERKRGSFFLWAVLTSDVVVGLIMFL